MPESLILSLTGLVVVLALIAIGRGYDVRLVLLVAAVIITAFVGKFLVVPDQFLKTMGEGKIIGPICSAMGYSFLLKYTGCDVEMVRLLSAPMVRVRALLIPATCLIGFITNAAITSQTATAAAVAPVLIPVLKAAGFRPVVVAAALILGCSAGGNLFNPGEPDIVAIKQASGLDTAVIISRAFGPELVAFAAAVICLWGLSLGPSMRTPGCEQTQSTNKIRILHAILPPLPVLLLFALQPSWGFQGLAQVYPDGVPVVHIMLFCSVLVFVVTRPDLSEATKRFFEGLGYGYVHVISLIIAASCFIAALDAVGLIKAAVSLVSNFEGPGKALSLLLTFLLSLVSGSGTAPSVGFSKAIVPSLMTVDPIMAVDAGVLGAVGASFGRTFSPVAAVVLFLCGQVHVTPKEARAVLLWPIVSGLVACLLYAYCIM